MKEGAELENRLGLSFMQEFMAKFLYFLQMRENEMNERNEKANLRHQYARNEVILQQVCGETLTTSSIDNHVFFT